MKSIQVIQPAEGVVVVTPVGDIDLVTAPRLLEQLLRILRDAPTRLVVALNEVTFIDSSGLNALVSANRRAEAMGTELRLAAPAPLVTKLLQITGLDSYLVTKETIEDALD